MLLGGDSQAPMAASGWTGVEAEGRTIKEEPETT
jgi:hypothetical protein